MAKTYNGYKNWQTWNIALWCGNDEGVYRLIREQGRFNRERARAFIYEVYPNGTPDMESSDEYRGVDWQHISRALNELRD